MKKTIFLPIFLILLVFPNITNKIGLKIRSVLQLQVGPGRDFEFPFRYLKHFRQDYLLIATQLIDLSKELEKRDITLHPVFFEGPRDNNNDVLNPLQSKIFYNFLEQDISQFKKIYTNKSIFSYEVMKQYPEEFTKKCEYRYMRQDGHSSPKVSFYTYRALIEQMGMKHNWSNVEFKKHTDGYSTELIPFLSNISIMNLGDVNTTEEVPRMQKYFLVQTNSYNYRRTQYPDAINPNTILIFGDSFSLFSVNYFTHFKTVYFIRFNLLGHNYFDLNQFLIDHPEIDDIILQTAQGALHTYYPEIQKLIDNLQK